MNQTTKKQHYIWRSYLAPWTRDNSNKGQIICRREGRIFPVSLMNVAHENYFYEVKELSKREIELIYGMTIRGKTGIQKTVGENWLNLYCASFKFARAVGKYLPGNDEKVFEAITATQEFKDYNIESIEKLHGKIETQGMEYVKLLREDNIGFWESEIGREDFSFFLANQYFRTKKMRNGILYTLENARNMNPYFKDIRPENMWIPLSLILASYTGEGIISDYSIVLIHTDNRQFIVGDQPVINTYSVSDGNGLPEDLELFYPITPQTALLVTKKQQYKNEKILKITSDELQAYNTLEWNASSEMIFAKESEYLEKIHAL